MPNDTRVNIIETPPILINGSVCPVTGKKSTATAILMKACSTNEILKPTPKYAAKGSLAKLKIRLPLSNKKRKQKPP